MQNVTQVTGSGIPLLLDDIDTDRIIPARFLRCVTFDGLGEHAFEDDREQDKSHPFDDARFQQGAILISGRNFGCGSSREHAPQALMRWGVKAVIAESFAEIFFGNCTTLGIPCVCANRADLDRLASIAAETPQQEITVDLMTSQVRTQGLTCDVTILESARSSLTTGNWDFLGQLLEGDVAVKQTAATLPYMSGYRA
jgi:3-isopropylmalate/(R)-2-methylmalate dehydratase small subunit